MLLKLSISALIQISTRSEGSQYFPSAWGARMLESEWRQQLSWRRLARTTRMGRLVRLTPACCKCCCSSQILRKETSLLHVYMLSLVSFLLILQCWLHECTFTYNCLGFKKTKVDYVLIMTNIDIQVDFKLVKSGSGVIFVSRKIKILYCVMSCLIASCIVILI